jgi:hypothetical protein
MAERLPNTETSCEGRVALATADLVSFISLLDGALFIPEAAVLLRCRILRHESQ